MIIVLENKEHDDLFFDLSNPNTIDELLSLGKISNFEIHPEHEEIVLTVNYDKGYEKKYGKYYLQVKKYLLKIRQNFLKHMLTGEMYTYGHKVVKLSFLDEINLVGVLFVDKIVEKSPNEMRIAYKNTSTYYSNSSELEQDLKDEIRSLREKNLSDDRYTNNFNAEPFGFFDEEDDNIEKLAPFLQREFGQERTATQKIEREPIYLELMGCFIRNWRAIYLCPENIEKAYNNLKGSLKVKYDSFVELVLLHEFGHSIFQLVGKNPREPILNETRANYFASHMTDGLYDKDIYSITRFQSLTYQFPYLSMPFMMTKTMTSYWARFHSGVHYDDVLSAYYKKVGILYGLL